MKNASHPQALCDLREHRRVVDEDRVRWGGLGKVKSEPEDLDVELSHSNKTRRDECVHKPVEPEGANAAGIDLARLITNDVVIGSDFFHFSAISQIYFVKSE